MWSPCVVGSVAWTGMGGRDSGEIAPTFRSGWTFLAEAGDQRRHGRGQCRRDQVSFALESNIRWHEPGNRRPTEREQLIGGPGLGRGRGRLQIVPARDRAEPTSPEPLHASCPEARQRRLKLSAGLNRSSFLNIGSQRARERSCERGRRRPPSSCRSLPAEIPGLVTARCAVAVRTTHKVTRT